MSFWRSAMKTGIEDGVDIGVKSALTGTLPKPVAELVMEYRTSDLQEIARLRRDLVALRLRACIRENGYCRCEACKALDAKAGA